MHETLCFSIQSPSPNLDDLPLRCDGCETVSCVVGYVRIILGSSSDHARIGSALYLGNHSASKTEAISPRTLVLHFGVQITFSKPHGVFTLADVNFHVFHAPGCEFSRFHVFHGPGREFSGFS